MAESNVPRMAETQYMPPTIEDVNTLGHYPFVMACLLAHVALEGIVDTDILRNKISELSDGEVINSPLDAQALNGSRMVLKTLNLISVKDIEPELMTKTNKASIARGIPLVGVLGGLRCDTPDGADIRPIFEFNSRYSVWGIAERMDFFDYVINAGHCRASDIREYLDMPHTVFIKQMERFEVAGVIMRQYTRPSSRFDATNIVVPDEVCGPMGNLLKRYKGLESVTGQQQAANRAYEILDNPRDFAQLLNSGIAPRRHKDKALRASMKPNIKPKQEVQQITYPEISPEVLAVFDTLRGSPLNMAYLLAHCENPQGWFSHGTCMERLDGWGSGIDNAAAYGRVVRARSSLISSGMLQKNARRYTCLTPTGILEGIPPASVLARWWLDLPADAPSRRLLEAETQLSRELRLLNAILNLEGKRVRSFIEELDLRQQDYIQLNRLSAAGIIDIDRKSSSIYGRIRNMQVVPTERPDIVDLLKNLRALKNNEHSAVNATAGAVAMARSSELLGEFASIVWRD